MSYAEIMNRLRIKNRVERHYAAIQKEQEIQRNLLKALGNDISAVTGESIRIGCITVPSGKQKTVNTQYNRTAVAARVVELRDKQNMSFTTIAATLNAEGFKPRTAESFSQATVYQLYRSAAKEPIAANAAA